MTTTPVSIPPVSTPPVSTPPVSTPIVEFRNVQLSYDGHLSVLKDIDLTVCDGDFRFLTGPSGAGKTSLLKMIYLALRPTSGEVRIFGEDVTSLPREALPPLRRRIGVVFQEFRLIDHLTAFENVALPMRVTGVNPNDYARDVTELLTWVGLGDRMDALPETLSGGEKQRVALARALVAKPDMILADEPTGNVDPIMGERIMRLFGELNKLGTAVIVATHDLDLVRRMRKNILRLKDGQLTLHGPLKPRETASSAPLPTEGAVLPEVAKAAAGEAT